MVNISEVRTRIILDSRGNPTVEAEIEAGGKVGRAGVPSGASTGTHEALELRDGGTAFHGKGVTKAVSNIREKIAPKIIGMDVSDIRTLDKTMLELDGTPNKNVLGANAILACSLAAARVASTIEDVPLYVFLGKMFDTNAEVLPTPSLNVINGGEHAGNDIDIQEHMILPIGASSYTEALQIGSEVYQQLGKILKKRYGPEAINVGDEGGFAPPLKDADQPFEVVFEAVEECGYGGKVAMGLDAAASSFFSKDKERYIIAGKEYTNAELVDFYKELSAKFPIISNEDPFDEEDWEGFSMITKELGSKMQIVGDDLFVTNPIRLNKGFELAAANALLLKVNQIGSLSESMDAARASLDHGYGVMVSHRSGETCDSFIADLTVGLEVGQLKSGAPCRGERTSKYNQLLRIEESLGSRAKYAGNKPFVKE